MRDEHYTPFRGRAGAAPAPERAIYRFIKGAERAEIRERTPRGLEGIEWLAFIGESLLESRLYHGARLASFAQELEERRAAFVAEGWTEVTLDATK